MQAAPPRGRPCRWPFAIAVALALAPWPAARADIPPPSQTPARVIVSGRTSTARDVQVVAVGHQIPRTYSGTRLRNTPAFAWYVSQHYALKTDYKPAKARFYLTLLELAYPHYVQLFGGEPPDIHERRMAVCYASSRQQLDAALRSEDIHPGFRGGGITYEGIRCAYNYPSGTLQYHQRYIVLHECVHLFQMCLAGTVSNTPEWYYEGIAEAFASHVYDTRKRQLTVLVRDKAPTINHFDRGIALYRKKPYTPQDIVEETRREREAAVLLVCFLTGNPERDHRFRIFRDQMLRRATPATRKAAATRLLQQLYGPWSQLNAQFKQWAAGLQSTFHYAEWGWEQDGNALWSFGFATDGKLSQTDVYLPPGQRPAFDPFRMDYPASKMPGLVGPVARGVAEPSVGCLIDFSRCPGRGRAGIGLGLIADTKPKPPIDCLALLIEAGKTLAIDGTRLGMASKKVALPNGLRDAMAAGGHAVGMTVKIAKAALEVTLRARAPKAPKAIEFKASVAIDAPQRQRLLLKPLTLLSRDGWHGLTPFFDDRRRLEPNLLTPAPPNRWRNPADRQLAAVHTACWRLGPRAPASLLALRDTMIAAADKNPATQRQALAAYDAGVQPILRDIRRAQARPEAARQAVADLIGLSLALTIASDPAPNHVQMTARLTGPLAGRAEGEIHFATEPVATASAPAPERVALALAQDHALITRRVARLTREGPFATRARADLVWRGERISLTATRQARPSIPHWWVIGPFNNPGGERKDIRHPLETHPVDLKRTYLGPQRRTLRWHAVARDPASDLGAEHLVDLVKLYGQATNVAAYALVWIDAAQTTDAVLAVGSDDGIVVWFNGRRIHTNLVPRPYASKADRVPLRLRRGRNHLLLKITQGMGDWSFCAHLEDPQGRPLRGVATSLGTSPWPAKAP